MNKQYFKLVPISPEEIDETPQMPFVAIFPRHEPSGVKTSTKDIYPNHLISGLKINVASYNFDKLVEN